MFENLNPYSNIEFLKGDSEDDLKRQILSIGHPIKIHSMYAVGAKHVVWFSSDVKIVKKQKSSPKKV